MSPDPGSAGTGSLAELEAFADRTIARGSRSFAAAARLFDPATRGSAMMLYAWCRHCDDVIDGQHLGFAAPSPDDAVTPQIRLRQLEEATRRAFAGEAMAEPSFRALQVVAHRHAIPEQLALDHLGGFRMDVEERRYRTLEDTLGYCYGVAGVVGVMMAMVMGARAPETLDRACDLGLAFQLTNIARDVLDDAHAGRVYLPSEWLAEAGIPEDEVADPRHRERLAVVAARLVEAAEPYYASALGGLPALAPRSAWAIATAHGVYRQIGLEVRRLGPRAWDGRVSTSRADKVRHVAQGAAIAVASRFHRPAPRPAGLWTRPR